MEMIKKLIIATALAASLMPVLPVYAMGLDESDEDEKSECSDNSESAAAVAVVTSRALPDLEVLKGKRESLGEAQQQALRKKFMNVVSLNIYDDEESGEDEGDEEEEQKEYNTVRSLLDAGLDPNGIHKRNMPFFIVALSSQRTIAIATLLLEYGADINQLFPAQASGPNRQPDTALAYMVRKVGSQKHLTDTDRARIQFLLDKGANPNIVDAQSPLSVALFSAHHSDHLVITLLEGGADVNMRTCNGTTLLWDLVYHALTQGKRNINAQVSWLLASGADETTVIPVSQAVRDWFNFTGRGKVVAAKKALLVGDIAKLNPSDGRVVEIGVEKRDRLIAQLDRYERIMEDLELTSLLPRTLLDLVWAYGMDLDTENDTNENAQMKRLLMRRRLMLRSQTPAVPLVSQSAAQQNTVSVAAASPIQSAAAVATPVALDSGSGTAPDNSAAAQEDRRDNIVCSACTFINAPHNPVCEMCGHSFADEEAFFFDVMPEDRRTLRAPSVMPTMAGESAAVAMERQESSVPAITLLRADDSAAPIVHDVIHNNEVEAELLTQEQRSERVRRAWAPNLDTMD